MLDNASLLEIFSRIEQISYQEKNIKDYIQTVHQYLLTFLPVQNFYLALFDAEHEVIEFVYFADEEEEINLNGSSESMRSPLESPTSWVIIHCQELNCRIAEEVWGAGPRAENWFGIPLLDLYSNCTGVLVTQSYIKDQVLCGLEKELFRVIANYVARALEKYKSKESNEKLISRLTKNFEKHIAEQSQSEKLQQVLFEITSFANEQITLQQLYKKVHESLELIVDASNFCISRLDKNLISIVFISDEEGAERYLNKVYEIGPGMNSYILMKREAAKFNQEIIKAKLISSDLVSPIGKLNFRSWIGAPMICDGELYGALSIQSYFNGANIDYSEEDLEILQFIANQVAVAIQSKIKSEQLTITKNRLKLEHELEKEQNEKLKNTLSELKSTQLKLVQKEKMASLGGVVAGVAHEINTPLGICITSISHSENLNQEFLLAIKNRSVSAALLKKYAHSRDRAYSIVDENMQRVEVLLNNFSDISQENSSNQVSNFNLKEILEEVIQSVKVILKPLGHNLNFSCDTNINVVSVQSPIQKIILNLVVNSIHHAYPEGKIGQLYLSVIKKADRIIITYQDDGKGMSKADLDKLFDPFFTTKRGAGGSGLGAHHIYNLVVTSLKGTVKVTCPTDKGLKYKIEIPENIKF